MEVKLRNVIPTWSGVAVFNGLTRAGWNPVAAFLEAERRTRGSAPITNTIPIGAGAMTVEAPGKSWDLSPFLKAGRIRLSDIPEGEARGL
jgi:hypothetical protein